MCMFVVIHCIYCIVELRKHSNILVSSGNQMLRRIMCDSDSESTTLSSMVSHAMCHYRFTMVMVSMCIYMPVLEHFVVVLDGVAYMPSLTFSSVG